jgi:hypothetical protein
LWERRRYLNGPAGALCTTELKKSLRQKYETLHEIQVFGYTSEEAHRAQRFREQNPEVMLSTPLIEAGLTKSDTIAMIERAGIEIPAMYKLGYRNNNCIGCVKGGMGYWNKIRISLIPSTGWPNWNARSAPPCWARGSSWMGSTPSGGTPRTSLISSVLSSATSPKWIWALDERG